ncbi:MAG: bifunctional glutamate N-acetyltransferase/amino-acid acetyltransferase ArgJ [Planctomycetes bacterium]|nr:bifunctional glutamate N-acetyltransferase/amino-acid acetyltransferase ArgJ [Planctomycetota bacterium]
MKTSGVLTARGFTGAAIHCGIKTASKKPDLAVIFSETPASVAAVFTKNKVCAAPVRLSRRNVRNGRAQAIVVNSGNANACTGRHGMRDAAEMAKLAAHRLGVPAGDVLVASTGIIGHLLPVWLIAHGLDEITGRVKRDAKTDMLVAEAICTTDTFPKRCSTTATLGGKTVTIGGIAKGAGMIEPNMATMLCFLTTDAAIPPQLLQSALAGAVNGSFNKITVDGHTSTNDTVAILANGRAGNKRITPKSTDYRKFAATLGAVAIELAQMIVRDGEGATKFVEITVRGAKSEADADKIARSIANSPLVKCALNGCDPNWGRIVSAAGYAGAAFIESKAELRIGDIRIFANGLPIKADKKALARVMRKKEIVIDLHCKVGTSAATIWTCDLSHDYVTINAEYHT